jgi:prepilin-type N-terminal cleavage/methylation domain-containing protein
MKTSKGFTIIELLVVVAIIAVLTGIVLVNVTSYIAKGKDAAVKGNMSTMLTDGAVFYDSNSTYTGFYSGTTSPITTTAGCTGNSGFVNTCTAMVNAGYNSVTFTCAGAANCNTAGATGWCAMVTEKANTNTFCVDSTGAKIEKASGTCVAGVCG